MSAVLASAGATRPLLVSATSTRRTAGNAAVRPASSAGRMGTVRSATLNLARSADDLRAASSMTAAARRFAAAAPTASAPARGAKAVVRTSRR
jgi:hypothetical protein